MNLTSLIFNSSPLQPPTMNRITLVEQGEEQPNPQADPFGNIQQQPESPDEQSLGMDEELSVTDGIIKDIEDLNVSKDDGLKAAKSMIQKGSLDIEQVKELIETMKQTELKPDKTNMKAVGILASYYYLGYN